MMIARLHRPGFLAILTLAALPVTLLAEDPKPNPAQQPGGARQPAVIPAGPAVAPANAELPVSRVVLFSSGVGYFEHAGSVNGEAELRLMFKTEQINDVLKSMVLMDLDGGAVTSATYAANEPVSRALRSFGVDISGSPTLTDLLRQLRGAVVIVSTPEPITGSILNVEDQTKVVGNPPVQIVEHYLSLVTDKGIRTVPLSGVSNLTFVDEKLRDELGKALKVLVESRDTDRKPVDIRFVGQGKRKVRVGYLAETPVWKTTYRLDLSGEKPFLQGWAIVENTSDTDWQGVQLSLVSGRPISFVQDLYTPLYLPRPVVTPPMYASLMPKMYDEGINFEADAAAKREAGLDDSDRFAANEKAKDKSGRRELESRDGVALRKSALAAAAPGTPMAANALQEQSARGMVALGGGGSGVQSVASGASLGELFSFQIQHPVDLPRRRSAMLPIINQDVTAEKVSIYNQSVLGDHPLNGVWLTNDTKLKMLAGPVTVFDGGAYAGDAQVDHLAPGDKRLLSYAVDLSVTVDPSVNQANSITAARIVRGVLEVTQLYTFDQLYKIKNKAEVERAVIVEHPFINGRELKQPDKAEEKTPTVYRFRVPVKAGETKDFSVKEQQVQLQGLAILPMDIGTLNWYATNGQIKQEVRDALAKAVQLRNELTQLQQQAQQFVNEDNTIKAGHERIRENIKTVGGDSTLGKRLVEKLSKEEDRIDELEKKLIPATQENINAKQKELEDYLNKLNIGV